MVTITVYPQKGKVEKFVDARASDIRKNALIIVASDGVVTGYPFTSILRYTIEGLDNQEKE